MAAWTASKPAYPTVESRFYFDVEQKMENIAWVAKVCFVNQMHAKTMDGFNKVVFLRTNV